MTFSKINRRPTLAGDERERSEQGPCSQKSVSTLTNNHPQSGWGCHWKAQHLLEFQLPSKLILSLLQLLTLLDVLFLEVMDLCLHRLKLGEELEPRREADEEGDRPDNRLLPFPQVSRHLCLSLFLLYLFEFFGLDVHLLLQ